MKLERKKAGLLVALTFLPILFGFAILGIYLVYILIKSMGQTAPDLAFLLALCASMLISSAIAWLVWLQLGRFFLGGQRVYNLLEKSTYPIFIPGSAPSRFFLPVTKKYDEILQKMLGLKLSEKESNKRD